MVEPKGGTEILYQTLLHKLGQEHLQGVNLFVNDLSPKVIKADQLNILWNHHSYNQPAIQNYKNRDLLNQIQYFVYVSNWQYEKYRYQFQIPESRSLVIKNAVELIEPKEKTEKIHLIYTSTPWRGLDILLEAFTLLDRDDVELDIYSSTIIYGTQFFDENQKKYEELFEQARVMKNVNYYGYASNQEVREALSKSHIFAYPSTWEETSCLCAIEAGMAGLRLVSTNLGALYETINSWGRLVSYDSNKKNLARKFAFALNKSIDEYWTKENQAKLKEQHAYYKTFYSWESRITEWKHFLQQVRNG